MLWKNVQDQLPECDEIVLLANTETCFIGFRRRSDINEKNFWWAINPNPGYAPIYVPSFKPTHWTKDIQPERLNSKGTRDSSCDSLSNANI